MTVNVEIKKNNKKITIDPPNTQYIQQQ